jgi:hypothetical protein
MRTYPGDELVPNPTFRGEYSQVMSATPEEIWPWLVQVGYHRGGWYVDTWWDEFEQRHFWPRVVPPEARGTYEPPAEAILPEYQGLKVGDIVPDGPPNSAWYTVERLEANRALVLYSTSHFKYAFPFLRGTRFELSGAFSWAFVLDPIDATHTRLTLVNRTSCQPKVVSGLLNPVYSLVDGAHQRQILKGIKRRVEQAKSAS